MRDWKRVGRLSPLGHHSPTTTYRPLVCPWTAVPNAVILFCSFSTSSSSFRPLVYPWTVVRNAVVHSSNSSSDFRPPAVDHSCADQPPPPHIHSKAYENCLQEITQTRKSHVANSGELDKLWTFRLMREAGESRLSFTPCARQLDAPETF